MEKQLGHEYPEGKQRESFLKDNCDAVENKGYMKPYTTDQLVEMKENLAEASISLNDIEIEVELYSTVNGRDVTLQLVSPGANQLLEDIRDSVLDERINALREIAPQIVIIEI